MSENATKPIPKIPAARKWLISYDSHNDLLKRP